MRGMEGKKGGVHAFMSSGIQDSGFRIQDTKSGIQDTLNPASCIFEHALRFTFHVSRFTLRPDRIGRQAYHVSRAILVLLWVLISVGWVEAQAIPELTSISPQGGPRGTTVKITLQAKNISEATALRFSGAGVSGELKEMERQAAVIFSGSGVSGQISSDNRWVAQVTIAPDAPLGMRELRVVTPKGVSNGQRFIVGDLPEMMETEPNSKPDQANRVTLPVTISGHLESVDDLDFFRFSVEKGRRLICEVNASRMGSPLDSLLTLFDAMGKEVASDDFANGLDALIDYTVPATGDYTLQIRDVRYKGGPQFVYRLSIGELPHLDSIFPLGGRRGTETTISVSGRNLANVSSIKVSLAPDAPLGSQEVRVMTPAGLSTNPHLFVIGDLPEFVETEPNNMRENANAVMLPVTINGQINPAGDRDGFAFKAEKGQRLAFEVNANRLGSKLDAVLILFDANGKELMINDDAIGAEARIDFNFQEARDYSIAVRDLNNRGGADFTYRLSITPPQPDFSLTVAPDNPRVNRGGCTALTVTVNRLNGYDGALRFAFPNLPKDFALSPVVLAPNQTQTLITLTAPMDAPLGLLPISVVGIGAIEGQRAERKAQPDAMLLTVMEAPQFLLEVAQVSFSVMQTRSVTLRVTATRREGFARLIALSVVGLPPRATASGATIPEGQNEATLTIDAGSFAGRELIPVLPPVGTQYIVVNGTATVNNESVTQSASALPLTITEAPFVLSITPVRLSILLPASPVRLTEAAQSEPVVASKGNDTPTENVPEKKAEEAMITLNVTRQGGFTDKVDIVPVDLPEGFRAAKASIPDHETEAKITLMVAHNTKPDTYNIKFTGRATINGQQVEQDSPTIAIKIIGAGAMDAAEK